MFPSVRRKSGDQGGKPRSSTGDKQETRHGRPRGYLAAALLFLATAAFVWWQNSRVAVLWDLGYLLDSSWRMALGQVPYRDFPFVHAPLTFLVHAGLIRIVGRHYLAVVAYAAAAGGLGTLLAWRILLRVSGRSLALLLALPLTVLGIYSVYPHPIYDCDCALAILFAVLLLARTGSGGKDTRTGLILPFASGAATVLPLFFKQNMGLPFLAAVAVGMAVLVAIELRSRSIRAALGSPAARVLAGMGLALLLALVLIASTAGVSNYAYWTMQFAAQRRLPGLGPMLAVYSQPSFAWTVPTLGLGLALCYTRWAERWWARLVAFGLMASPFAGSLIFLLIDDDADERADNLLALWPLLLLAAAVAVLFELRRGITLGRLIPFFVLAAIHGTFLSQQLWGSTYALWPLLLVLTAYLLAALPARARPVAAGMAGVVSATFLVCGGLYAVSLERLAYIHIPDAPLAHASTPALRGMAAPGPYLPNLDELVDFAGREIPQGDALLLFPGEDPFYYATGRTPEFPVTLFDPGTDPFSAAGLIEEARRQNVRWVIVKRELEIDADPMPESGKTMQLARQEFALYRRLRGYDVYRRRGSGIEPLRQP